VATKVYNPRSSKWRGEGWALKGTIIKRNIGEIIIELNQNAGLSGFFLGCEEPSVFVFPNSRN